MRIKIIKGFLLLILLVTIGYAFYLQVLNGEKYVKKAVIQHQVKIELLPERGKIFDRKNTPLVVDEKAASVYILPQYLEDPGKACALLSEYGLGTKESILRKILRNKRFFWLKRKMDYALGMRLKEELRKNLLSNAIGVVEEKRRIYPWGEITASLIGFVGREHHGLSGVEFVFDTLLSGKKGWALLQKDPFGREYPYPSYPIKEPEDGVNITLTIDLDVQKIVYEELKKSVKEWNAKRGSVIVMDAKTGEILAAVDYPDFLPQRFLKYPKNMWKLAGITDEFEPGSVFKPLTGIICLEEGLAVVEEYIPTGRVFVIQKRKIHDVHPKNGMSFVDVFVKSSNIGVAKLALRVGRDRFYKYAKLVGIGSPTGIAVPGEAKGYISPPEEMTPLRLTNNAFGQGISLTLLQLIKVYSVFANEGRIVEPWLVKKIVSRNGKLIFKGSPYPKKRIFSKKAANIMKEILYQVVERGTGKEAKIEGIDICGKTGTAQKPIPGEGYSDSKVITTFVGFFPKDSPSVIIGIMIDEPNPPGYAGTIAAPLFRRIAERMINLPLLRSVSLR